MTFPELFALPVTVDLATAARALGISMTTAYRLTQRNAFPCAIMRPTYRYRIPTASLLTALDIDLQPVHPDDVENGIEFARRFTQT
ncbi:helix-turn-helix domain-containing protein [Actinocrinis puniceicyclus]|uniref:Helix-turn-helix domain-containing protein n=1 Tax=Actinocrinis puniceicyclus TaxID=977794 RepID=A0A8J7WQ77_9ACTN|nr:helix-turn-helix domain-containing protein [Actinocrinis puniceicyclus]MBS2966493.1 helix-turn-helix domain-containing protein [Actinocrinis puniceicyclus]